mmetsp:Transcript_16740/g.48051  ORF Transcript_16740/g.48051 Transcript_16740/m.48051 type:complete len:320 (+) Transcript_16740:57-1016(+)
MPPSTIPRQSLVLAFASLLAFQCPITASEGETTGSNDEHRHRQLKKNLDLKSSRHLKHNFDPTPPGYEDAIWCPRGTCNMEVTNDLGAAGPSRFFHECYSTELSTFVEEAWTGSRTDIEPPREWITEPELKKCRQSPVHWSEVVRKDGVFGTFRIVGSDANSSSRNVRGRPLSRADTGKSKWCWDVKGGMKPGNKVITKKCDEDSTKQLFVFKIAQGSAERGYQKITLHPKRKKSLCVGVARIQGKSWLRLERCIDNDDSQIFGQNLRSDLCGRLDIPNADLVVTTQGLEPSKGTAVMLRSEKDSERFRDAIAMWCPSK